MSGLPWDDRAPLPEATTWLLEASAGTGKTYQIASLVVRLVAEYGVSLERILVITFTKAATAELKDRIRARLRGVLGALDALDADGETQDDSLVAHLRALPGRAEVRQRVGFALRTFDVASISTIHSFCQRMLGEFAFDSGQEARLELLADNTRVLDDIVDDTLATLYSELSLERLGLLEKAGVTRANLLQTVKAMAAPTEPRIVPDVGQANLDDLLAVAELSCEDGAASDALPEKFAPLAVFAREARRRVERELTRRRALTYDGMLSRLAERVAEGGGAESPIAARICERFDAALVDEFQDTDAAQWTVLREAFHGRRRLFLIGDPKQAIYGFRGADLNVYLEAAKVVEPECRRTMTSNWRSDPKVVEAANVLFREGSHPFDVEGIDYVRVDAKRPARLASDMPGLEVRWVDERVRTGPNGVGQAIGQKRPDLFAKLATREALAWLHGERSDLAEEGGGRRRVTPGDLAVLVNDRRERDAIRRAFARAGIPTVGESKNSVFGSRAATWVVVWLDAVAEQGRGESARAAVVTPLFGWTAADLAWSLAEANGEAKDCHAKTELACEIDWDGWVERLRAAAGRYRERGFAVAFDHEATELGVYKRLLRMEDGERHATDLRHLFEVLNAEERARRLPPAGLADWLRGKVSERVDGVEEASQRLESDAMAVRVETIHASKGLEYPIVLVPFAWAAKSPRKSDAPILVPGRDRTLLDVGPGSSARRDASWETKLLAEREEALRKTYVALTRARHHAVVWYGPVGRDGARTSATPLGRLLMRSSGAQGFDDTAMPSWSGGRKADPASAWRLAQERLNGLAAASRGTIAWREEGPPDADLVWTPPALSEPPARCATAATFPRGRSLKTPWIVTSYSRLAHGGKTADPDEKLEMEAPEGPVRTAQEALPLAAAVEAPKAPSSEAPSSHMLLGRGTAYGTLCHAVLEGIDFQTGAAKDGRTSEELIAASVRKLALGANEPLTRDLADALPAVLATPLGTPVASASLGLPADFALANIRERDRLDEVAFDLRVGAGTAWTLADAPEQDAGAFGGLVRGDEVLDVLLKEPPSGEVSGWLRTLAARRREGPRLFGDLVGILNGSIDLVFRARTPDGDRYYLADYKTNRIEVATPGFYSTPWLAWEMTRAGYFLQSVIYSLALHLHCKARLRTAYDYDTHFGGALYLFLRGMTGSDGSRDERTGYLHGVFAHRWSREVIEGLERVLTSPEGRRP